MQNIILHLDMNSYFATCEQQDNLAWRNKPLGVCEHLGGIIIAASVQAKKWGIGTGTPVWEAKKIYPKIILTKTSPEKYRFYTKCFTKLISEYTDKVELTSIDEAYLDITRTCNIRGMRLINPFEEAVRMAQEIKQRFKTEVGDYLTCSIGIGENKLVAKIASDMKKPNGLAVITEGKGSKIKIQNLGVFSFTKNELYNNLKLTDIPGIGPRQEKNLKLLGIHNLGHLRDYPKSLLVAHFGIHGEHLHNMGQLTSSWEPKVEQGETIKSMGHMYTLPKEFREQKFFIPVLYKLCEMVGRRLRRKKLEGNVLHFYVHDRNYRGFGGSEKLGDYIFDGREIFLHAVRMFKKFKPKNSWEFKLIGVTVAHLRSKSGQLSLFGHREKSARLSTALDKINDKYGEFTVFHTPVLAAGKVFRDSIGFGRIKELKYRHKRD